MTSLAKNSLVLYRNQPACVRQVDDKIEIELETGRTVKVRPKDVALLHPGPLQRLAELDSTPAGEIRAAWELLAGGQTSLAELAELAYGAYTPVTAWSAWQSVAEGVYFQGEPDGIIACTPDEVAHKLATLESRAAEKQAWETFLMHVRAGQTVPEDSRYLVEVEDLALKRTEKSRVLRELGRDESPENAHGLLLELGRWRPDFNPYPLRLGVTTDQPEVEVPELPDEARLDLTGLPAYAIDDADTDVPDDALSYQPGSAGRVERLWVHIADPAALIPPGSAADLEAYARITSLYLPEGTVQMLPSAAIRCLGLGLNEVSPALSFGFDLDPQGAIAGLQIAPSWVRVTRLTYEQAEEQLDQPPFSSLYCLAQRYQARRRANGAVFIDMPEVKIRVKDGRVAIHLLPELRSRDLVQECMIMTGQAVADFSLAHDISMPFATQEASPPPEAPPQTLSEMFALRRTLKRSQYRSVPAPHAGLGLSAYVQATSPMRRYLDLVVHQQLRAHLRGAPWLDSAAILERVGAAETMLGSLRQAEFSSNTHWSLVYLLQNPDWRGQGVLVEKHASSGRLIIPSLAFETQLYLPGDAPLDSLLNLALRKVNLAHLDARFQVEA